jgi:hypothetical protein
MATSFQAAADALIKALYPVRRLADCWAWPRRHRIEHAGCIPHLYYRRPIVQPRLGELAALLAGALLPGRLGRKLHRAFWRLADFASAVIRRVVRPLRVAVFTDLRFVRSSTPTGVGKHIFQMVGGLSRVPGNEVKILATGDQFEGKELRLAASSPPLPAQRLPLPWKAADALWTLPVDRQLISIARGRLGLLPKERLHTAPEDEIGRDRSWGP